MFNFIIKSGTKTKPGGRRFFLECRDWSCQLPLLAAADLPLLVIQPLFPFTPPGPVHKFLELEDTTGWARRKDTAGSSYRVSSSGYFCPLVLPLAPPVLPSAPSLPQSAPLLLCCLPQFQASTPLSHWCMILGYFQIIIILQCALFVYRMYNRRWK